MTEQTPFAVVADLARELAVVAERYGALDPVALAPRGSIAAGDRVDPLVELDERAKALVAAVAACKVATWREISAREGGNFATVARLWDVSRQVVSKRLGGSAA